MKEKEKNPFDEFLEEAVDSTETTSAIAKRYASQKSTSIMSKIDDMRLSKELEDSLGLPEEEK